MPVGGGKVLSFKSLQQKAKAEVAAPSTLAAARARVAKQAAQAARVEAEAPEEFGDNEYGWSGEAQESWPGMDADEGVEVGEEALAPMTAKAKPATRPPLAAAPLPQRNPQPAAVAEEETVTEGTDWVADFEKKWAMALGEADVAQEGDGAERDGGDDLQKDIDAFVSGGDIFMGEAAETPPLAEPPQKKPRVQPAAAPAAPRPSKVPVPQRQPPVRAAPKVEVDAPITPGVFAAQEIKEERPEWAARCLVEAAKPGQPQRLTISMAEVGLEDAGATAWCEWMDKRLAAEQPAVVAGGRARFKAGMVDFSENKIGLSGVKALCALLEKHSVRCDVLRLSGNVFGNEGLRCVTKYIMSSSQPVVHELHVSKCSKIGMEGVRWVLGCISMHAAYPIWNSDTQRYLPLWLRIENAKLKGETALQGLASVCNSLRTSVCLGESMGDEKCGPHQCVNVHCSDELKHNCVAHICSWGAPEDPSQFPVPVAHGRTFFGTPGKGARKTPPSGVENPLRDEPRLLYEDDDVAVVLKPPGWSCLPNPAGVNAAWSKLKPIARRKQVGELMMQTKAAPLQAWLLLQFGADPSCDATRDQAICDRGMVHRLDIDTSGPMLVGKTMQGFEHAKKQIAAGILKDYVVLVHGTFSTDRGDCNAPIDTSPYKETKRVRVDESGQPATTVWEVIAEYESADKQESYTLVHCRMVTLRTHQIRVHMQHLGHPLVGDSLYGSGERPAFCPRMFVHKLRIGFFTPAGKSCIETCSLQTAPDLWQALGRLRKVGGMAMMGCGAPGR